jgi:hypothetical protein
MIKGAVTILVLGFAVVGGAYYFYSSWDPQELAAEARAAISPGMHWTQVVEDAGKPGKYQIIRIDEEEGPLGTLELRRPGTLRPFDHAELEAEIAAGGMSEGFTLNYVFSQQHQFRVWFDSAGNVEEIEENKLMQRLLQLDDD